MKIKKLTPNNNNIETYLPIFNGFYNNIYEPDFYGEREYYRLPKNFDFYPYFNNGAYEQSLAKYFCDCVEFEMKDFIERIDFETVMSPKEYNFSNDSINCIIRPKKIVIQKYIYENRENFESYLKDNLTSYSGFMSFHSNDFNDWEKMTKKFKNWNDSKGFNLGFILSFIANNENLEEISIFSEYSSHVLFTQFLSQEFYDLIDFKDSKFIAHNSEILISAMQSGYIKYTDIHEMIIKIRKFIKDNYVKVLDIPEAIKSEFSEIEMGFYDTIESFINIEKIVINQMKEIEELTLRLEL